MVPCLWLALLRVRLRYTRAIKPQAAVFSPSASILDCPDERADEQGEEDDEDKGYGAEHLTSILLPVSITMFLVCIVVRLLMDSPIQQQSAQSYSRILVYKESTGDSTGLRLGGALLNALLFTGVILSFTVVFYFLYKYRCMKIIYGWLAFSVISLLGFSGWAMFYSIITEYQLTLDSISFYFMLYNFAVVGTVAIFWHAPDYIKQGYLVAVSTIMAWVLTRLPEWTNWTVLAALALYDLFAVLSPVGPLKVCCMLHVYFHSATSSSVHSPVGLLVQRGLLAACVLVHAHGCMLQRCTLLGARRAFARAQRADPWAHLRSIAAVEAGQPLFDPLARRAADVRRRCRPLCEFLCERQPDVVSPRVCLAAEAHYQLSQGAGGEHGERVARAV